MESQSAVLLGPKSSTHEIITFYWIIVFYGQAAVNCTYSFSASLPAFRETHVATVSATLAVSLTTHALVHRDMFATSPMTWRVLQGGFTGGPLSSSSTWPLPYGSHWAQGRQAFRLSQGFGGWNVIPIALKKPMVFYSNWKIKFR